MDVIRGDIPKKGGPAQGGRVCNGHLLLHGTSTDLGISEQLIKSDTW